MRRLIFLLVLVPLPGCDAATAALILSAQDKKSSDDGPLPAPAPSLDTRFYAWTANIPDAPAEEAALAAVGGEPSLRGNVWTLIGNAAATDIFNPIADPASFNAILIQMTSDQKYEVDGIEVLDAQNTVLEYASGTVYASLVDFKDEILGAPDTKVAVSNASGAAKAFIFTLYTGPIDQFRITIHGTSKPLASGDIKAVGGFSSAGDERPGGLAIRASDGVIHLTLSVGDTARLVRYDLTGAFVDDVEISNDLVAVGNGSHSVALNSSGVVFTACSTGNGVIQVRRFEDDLTPGNAAGFASGFGNDRVEHNSIAVDSSGFVVVVGGMSSVVSGRNHWRVKIPPSIDIINDPPVWQNSSQLDGSTILTTYWHAVTTGANDVVFMTGDLNSGLLGTIQVYTAKFNAAGAPQWDESFDEGDTPADVGHAIALDSSGNVYVAGGVGTDTEGKDGVLLRYTADGGAPQDETGIVGAAGGNDEFLDVAVDQADGSIYAVGYETVTGEGENMVIMKFKWGPNFPVFTPVWVRYYHGGFGNDRAVSCAIYGNNLVVAGYETNSTGQTKLVLRVYEK
jgi:hypothetical protein